jgi:hypothetical protein
MNDRDLGQAGLDGVAALLSERGLGEISIEPLEFILGCAGPAGSSRPLPSSAARLLLGKHAVWVPVAEMPAQPGCAPFYRHGGQTLVMPMVRLFVRSPADKGATDPPEFLTLADWLLDAVNRWRFTPIRGMSGDAQLPVTLVSWLERKQRPARQLLGGVAELVRYALFGADRPFQVLGLHLPACPMWLRPAPDGAFARAAARGLVISARINADETKPAVPTTYLRASAYRIRPSKPSDWGIDPVHTPEGEDVRLIGRLGAGVTIADRKLRVPRKTRLPLSASTARVPFAGYNDPRRLLMAANMQTHAVPLEQSEPPRVHMASGRRKSAGERSNLDAPGVNLRVAYIAWRGLNHEDAWVVSESAAQKLVAVEDIIQTVAVRAIELLPEPLVEVGQTVQRGRLLVRRWVAPALLCASLEVLASLPELDERVALQPELDDFAPTDATVVKLERWDLANRRVEIRDESGTHTAAATWHVPERTLANCRLVYRVHLRRRLPLAVGDKLANRHGHKGVVGAILPDDQMPRWHDRPLEALIDPISVLNRSNWGQVYEALAGVLPGQSIDVSDRSAAAVLKALRAKATDIDLRGCCPIEKPSAGDWLAKGVRAVAGVQFVLRMPHHASDKISGSPVPRGLRLRRRAQRFGEMEHWALWAHGVASAKAEIARELTPEAERLGRLLAVAGFGWKVQTGNLVVRPLPLDKALPAGWSAIDLGKASSTELYQTLDQVAPEAPAALVFDPPLPMPSKKGSGVLSLRRSRPPTTNIAEKTLAPFMLRWLPVAPACDRPPRRLFDGSEEPHELTRDLRRTVRALTNRHQARKVLAELEREERGLPGSIKAERDEEKSAILKRRFHNLPILRERACQSLALREIHLQRVLRRLMRTAYVAAVGLTGRGLESHKHSFLRRGVLGHRLERSGRATISPGGPDVQDLNEIGLPEPLLQALFGPELPSDPAQRREFLAGRWVWLKRDPVLHRWGTLPVRVRPVTGDTIRLPASLLGPPAADFDGDTVAVFAHISGALADPAVCRPSAIAWHPLLEEPMFIPGKQYQYGLFLLSQDARRREAFRQELRQAGAPDCDPSAAGWLSPWVKSASTLKSQGRWWAIVESHALAALAEDPAMNFGVGTVSQLRKLPVVCCKAAKDLYDSTAARKAMAAILSGKSLAIYGLRRRPAGDPIAEVMVAAKQSVGYFGGALRRLIYHAGKLTPETVQAAQTLTERVTQKALSIKAGKPPIRYAQYEAQLQRLFHKQNWIRADDPELLELFADARFQAILKQLRKAMTDPPPVWLRWLRSPNLLAGLVEEAGAVALPLRDLRLSCWLAGQ